MALHNLTPINTQSPLTSHKGRLFIFQEVSCSYSGPYVCAS